MKIELDLEEILSSEFGDRENLAENIKDTIVCDLKNSINTYVMGKIREEVDKIITNSIRNNINGLLGELAAELIDTPFTPIDRYGSKGDETTIRNQIAKEIHDLCKFKNSIYASERNAFSSAVFDVLNVEIGKFKKEFDLIVSEQYVQETKAYAVKILKEKLGL